MGHFRSSNTQVSVNTVCLLSRPTNILSCFFDVYVALVAPPVAASHIISCAGCLLIIHIGVCLGMSVKIANMSGEKWYIGGAPRSKYYGQVLMFRQAASEYLHIERRHFLTGGQFGEGFGHDIAVADFNGDG